MTAGISPPTRSLIVSALKSSDSLSSTQSLHAIGLKLGFLPETLLSNHLLAAYCRCVSHADARILFDETPDKNLISYSTLISANSRSGDPRLALRLTAELPKLGLNANQYVFSSSAMACSKLGSVSFGEQIHSQVVVSGFESDPFVKSALINMYSKFGDPALAASVFRRGPAKDTVMFNSMVSGYVNFGSYKEALQLFVEGRQDFDFWPTEFTFGSLIKACSNVEREVGEQLHGVVVKLGFDSNCFVGTSLVDMYGNFGDIESAEVVFEGLVSVDTALYNAMIVGSSKNGLDDSAMEYFRKLRLEGLNPNECSFSSAIKACAGLKCLDLGRTVHGIVEKSTFSYDLVVETALIDMYMKCGKVEESRRIFDCMHEKNTISYNSMISGYGQNGNSIESVRLFIDMKQKQLDVDLSTFVAMMASCLDHEWATYSHAFKHGFGFDPMVQNALLDGLIKQGTAEAMEFFNKMKDRSVISWTTIISGLTQLGLHSNALEVFKKMMSATILPNSFTFSSVLKAIGSSAGLPQGRCIHGCVLKHGIIDEFSNSSLLDMYARCGALEDSRQLFHELNTRDIVAWNTMITSYAQHGYGHEALELYSSMENGNVHPNHVTFVSLLSACSHCGFVEKGVKLFEAMVSKHRITPIMEHCACMVDMFGRAGMLDRAKSFIDNMSFDADASIWTILLAACKLHGDVKLAQLARKHVMELQGEDNHTLVLISNMYSEVGKWDDAEITRKRMECCGLRKGPGLSWVETSKELVCDFVAA